MDMLKRSARLGRLVLAVGLIAAAGGAAAQEKTPALAFEFIRNNMTDQSWYGLFAHCDDNRQNCYDDYGTVSSVNYENNSYCYLRFTTKTPVGYTDRSIDLTRSIHISASAFEVIFEGPVRMTNGEITNRWMVKMPSWAIGQRVLSAFEYLQSQCKKPEVF